MTLPEWATDCHFHVFGGPQPRALVADAAWDAPNATIDRLLAMHAALGLQHGIMVQPSVYGIDHRALLAALAQAGPGYRGCVTARAVLAASDRELATLHEGGVRGARFSRPRLATSIAAADQARVLAKLAALGWYAKLQPDPENFAAMVDPFRHAGLPLLIDHMGRPDLRLGLACPNFLATQRLVRDEGAFVLLTLGDRISLTGPPWHDVVPLAQSLLALAPGRCLWGSDWPHLGHAGTPPDDAALLGLLADYAPDADLRQRVLVDNPAAFFGL